MSAAAWFRLSIQGAAFAAAVTFGFAGPSQARPHRSAPHDTLPREARSGALIAAARHSTGAYAASYRTGGRERSGRHAAWFHRGYAFSGGHSGGGIQCVTFARADTGIELSGNASAWWYNAAGRYQRGASPESGAVLNFRANGAMRMGHVSVVDEVRDGRTIVVDHANWGGPGAVRGGISRNITVVDVSPRNDWSAVRVALGHSGEFGSIYPTYGFIYNRPDGGAMVAAAATSAPVTGLNPAPRDLRGRSDAGYDEVAEAPDSAEPEFGRRGRRLYSLHGRRGHTLALATHHRTHHHA